jgi:hypothetical protein
MKPTRRDVSEATRVMLHRDRMRQADTPAKALWHACNWLRSEARRVGRIKDVTRAIIGLVALVQRGEAIPTELLDAAKEIDAAERLAPKILSKARDRERAA